MKKLATLFVTALLLMLCALPLINNARAAGNNLVPNPSVETSAGYVPTSWTTYKTGVNTTSYNYLSTGGHTGTRSLVTQMTARTSGQAGWQFNAVAVAPNTKYTFTDWYKSNVSTTSAVIVTRTDGTTTTLTSNGSAASTAWKQSLVTFTTPSNAKAITVRHYINKVGQLETDDFDLEGPAPVVPMVSITAPAANATVQNTQTLTASATNAAGVQFKVDNVNVGAEDTSAPYSVNWDTKTIANGSHTITATARSSSGGTATATRTVNVQNVAAPTVSITAPAANATVSGTATAITANATNAVGVQFKLDGANLGTEDTTAPYSTTFNTTTVANGNHTLTAVARNSASQSVTSGSVVVNVQNTVVTPPASTNLIPNPSFETASGSAPASWLSSNWGTNTAAFSYLNTGHTGTRSAKVEISAYTDGAANWYYADVPATVGKTYKYENWYQSNVDTEVDAEIVMADGSVQYAWLGTVFANANWTKFSTTYTVPAGAQKIAIYQILAKKGYIVSDDYSLSEYTPAPLNRGLVSVTFDDGWTNQYANALPTLQQLGIKSTFYLISGELNDTPDYMTTTQVKDLYAKGHEIGSHSVTHSDMTTLAQASLVNEFAQSKTTLQNLIGVPVTDFAYPYGAYNANTINTGKTYYQSQRTVNGGLNTKDSFDITQLKIYEVDSNISQAQVQGWINAAIAQHAWLILVYHEVANAPVTPDDALYTTKPADFAAEMTYLKNSGVTSVTVNQAINEILPQL